MNTFDPKIQLLGGSSLNTRTIEHTHGVVREALYRTEKENPNADYAQREQQLNDTSRAPHGNGSLLSTLRGNSTQSRTRREKQDGSGAGTASVHTLTHHGLRTCGQLVKLTETQPPHTIPTLLPGGTRRRNVAPGAEETRML